MSRYVLRRKYLSALYCFNLTVQVTLWRAFPHIPIEGFEKYSPFFFTSYRILSSWIILLFGESRESVQMKSGCEN